MEILDFAEKILYAESIEDKLFSPESFSLKKKTYKGRLPSLPSRPPELGISGGKTRTTFPKISELDQDEKRGQILHFFANHELLAMELMALCLLKLKDVPESFLTGIAHTIKEEQVHMRLYIERMNELGVNFGDIALNDFFWNALKDINNISDYVSGMSMTFEQANLDFSVQYHRAMIELGDYKTAEILKTVYDDEIGHVSFGLDWFEKLRPKKQDLFTEYKNSLKLPIDPHRAKSRAYFDVGGRQKVGFPKDYIEKLESYSSSVGRPARVFWYNADAELELQSKTYQRKKVIDLLLSDYSCLQMFMASEGDIVLTSKIPSQKFLKEMKDTGINMVEFIEYKDTFKKLPKINKPHLSHFSPWAFTPRSMEIDSKLTNTKEKLLKAEDSDFLDFYNKTNFPRLRSEIRKELNSSISYHEKYDGVVCRSLKEVYEQIEKLLKTDIKTVVIKEAYGFSGSGMKKVSALDEINENISNWITASISKNKAVYIEPWNEVLFEFSAVWDDSQKKEKYQAIVSDKQGQFKGHKLERFPQSVPGSLRKQLFEKDGFFETANKVVAIIRKKMSKFDYNGPAGIDFYIFRDDTDALHLKTFGEINPRTTMAHISNGFRKHLSFNTRTRWILKGAKDLKKSKFESWAQLYEIAKQDHPLVFNKTKWHKGIIFTNDPYSGNHAQSILAIGDEAISYINSQLKE